MDINARIAQFENMVQPGADPDNDMAWFSLGKAYADASRHADAANAYLRCTVLNKDMSKAYQLAGQAFIAANQNAQAIEVLTEGYKVAAARGDFMPKKAMGEMLEKLGAPLPAVAAADTAAALPPGTFICKRTGKAGHQLPRPPMRGAVGQWIYENISKETFDDWIKQGTKVINEMRLDFSRDDHTAIYDQHMYEYLGIDEALLASLKK